MTQTQLPFDSRASQESAILSYLRAGFRITPLEALEKFRCMRLGARIYSLKKGGLNIKSEMVEVPSGKRVKSYWLESK